MFRAGASSAPKRARSSVVEHPTFNRMVDGSNPSGRTTSLRTSPKRLASLTRVLRAIDRRCEMPSLPSAHATVNAMRLRALVLLAACGGLAACSSTSMPVTPAPSGSTNQALPTFADTDAVRLTDGERAAAIRDAKARFSDPTRPLADVPGGVVDTKTGTRYACVNFYGKKADGGNPLPVTVAGQFVGQSFAIISVGTATNNMPTWQICNRLGLSIDHRPYE